MPDRKCIACGKIQNRDNMIKLTKEFSTGKVFINKDSKQFGRSAYLCYNETCTQNALKKNKIEKALRCTVPDKVKGNLINEF
jgi:predicted RNA-binding protein YlxR (DUF448 family)